MEYAFAATNYLLQCSFKKYVAIKQPPTFPVPDDMEEVMSQYAIQGFRVMGLAWKPLDPKVNWHQVQRMSRSALVDDALRGRILTIESAS